MKKSKIYSLLACVCLLMQSCLFSEEDVFDQSSAQRAMESVEECNNLLQSSSNGWLMESPSPIWQFEAIEQKRPIRQSWM